MYKFGILGCGMIAGIHAKAIGAIKNARLIGVADANVEYSRAFARKSTMLRRTRATPKC